MAFLAVALGGALGSAARFLADVALGSVDGWPWSTLLVNVTGCLAIGAATRWIAVRRPHRLVRPFLVVGVLGGYTTFSAFAVQVVTLADGRGAALTVAYLLVTVAACLGAVVLGGAAGAVGPEREG